MKKLTILLCLLILTNLFGTENKKYIIVKKGETLWRISKIYKVPLEVLCKINNIKDKTKISAGMKLLLPSEPVKITNNYKISIILDKPVDGQIISNFTEGSSVLESNGVEFQTTAKAKVKCSSPGLIKFTGSLRGYGQVVIIEHTKEISTIYAYLSEILTKKGEQVKQNQIIGIVGKNNKSKENVLFFELLYNGKPIDPVMYLKK